MCHYFFATEALQQQLVGDFPYCLNGAPILLPSSSKQLRTDLDQWLNKQHIYPRISAEFDDSALVKAFGQHGVGIFMVPAAN